MRINHKFLQIFYFLHIILPLKLSNSYNPHMYKKGEVTISYGDQNLNHYIMTFGVDSMNHNIYFSTYLIKLNNICNHTLIPIFDEA